MSLHAAFNLLTAVSYYAIFVMLMIVLLRRQDTLFRRAFLLFGLFVFYCGTTHLTEIWTIWYPSHEMSGVIQAATALVSLLTAFELFRIVPQALTLASPAQLEATNLALERQISERNQIEEDLRRAADKLQQSLQLESLLKRITDKVRDSLDESQILQTALTELGGGLGVKACNAAMYDLKAGTATVSYEHTNSTVPVQGRVMHHANSPQIYKQLLAGQYFQYCSILPNPDRGRVAMLACPIIDDQGVLGDLWLINDQDYGFNDLEIRLVQQVANQCAIAIRQARLYQAAQAQVQELTRLNQMKDDFLSTVSHELRTPVANIKVASRMLELTLEQIWDSASQTSGADALLPSKFISKANQYLTILQNECQREIRLIEDLLDLRRLDEGQYSLVLAPIDLRKWIPQIVESFAARTQSRQQTLSYDIQIPERALFVSDENSLEQIVTELLNNACKYTPPGEAIAIQVSVEADQARFVVTNTGVEIPDDEIPLIFDKFYRVPSADPWKQGGTGLGLALVQKLTASLGGTISAQSWPDYTQFALSIPLSPERPPSMPVSYHEPEPHGELVPLEC